MRAAIYTRLSQDRPGEASRERQEADCRALCEAKGFEVVGVHTDLLSGYKDIHRPGYEALLDSVRAGEVDAAVFWKLDRLSRRGVVGVAELLQVFNGAGAVLVSVNDHIDTSTAMGRGILAFMASQAEQESENTSLRVRSAKEAAARDGRPGGGGTRPFGYQADRMTIEPDEAELVREAARRILAGESCHAVCADWQARGVRTPTGRYWQDRQLRQMLRSPRLRGLREHHGEIVGPAKWPAILDDLTGRRVASAVAFSGQRGRPVRSYLLTGIAVCGACDQKLFPQRRYPAGTRSYACVRHPGYANCGRLRIQADPLEHLVSVEVVARMNQDRVVAATGTPAADSDYLAVAHEETLLVDLAEMWAEGDMGRAEWLAARRKIEARLEAANRRIAARTRGSITSAFLRRPGALAEAWATTTLESRREIIVALIHRVTVQPATTRGPNFDSRRVSITWA